jgi:phosphoserine phosphatase
MPGTEEVLRRLQVSGSKVYILSGSIKCIIKRVLGNLKDYFEEIKANDFKWDQRGRLVEIIGTKFDFEGKADFIRQAVHENGIHSHEAFFVGNSSNDTFAHESGARTLCINPAQTNPDHPFHWNHAIKKCSNLNEIFDYFRT